MKDILFLGGSTGIKMDKIFSKVFLTNKSNEYNCINLSISGAGNFYIAGVLFEYIKNNKKPDYIFIKFTGLNRWDLPFDKKVKINDYPYQSSPKEENKSESFIQIDKNWVLSGGYTGAWLGNNILKKIFCYIYDLKDQNSTNDQSWQQIFSCISLCETLNIPYNWTFCHDPANPPSKSSEQDGYSQTYPEYISKKQMLDFAPLNFSYSINEKPEDGSHYSQKVLEKYFKEEAIFNKINNTIKNI